jgi:hypothetical protein
MQRAGGGGKFGKNALENKTTQLFCESCDFRQNYMKVTCADFRNFRPIVNNPRWLSEHARIIRQFLIFYKRFKNSDHLNFQIHAYKNVYVSVCMYVCMCICMCVYIYIYIYIYTHTHTYRSIAKTISQLKICDFSGEIFKCFEVL